MAKGQATSFSGLAPGIALVLLASLGLFHQLARDQRFHPDEAFFMTFARAAAVNGDWLLPGALDKPPLSIYFSALSMVAVGNTADAAGVLQLDTRLGEFAGRLPNALLGILLAALMLRLAWRVCGNASAGMLAGLLTATSPVALAYGASAFTDMSLVFCSVAALYCGLARHWGRAGIALGLAFWCKQQAVFAVAFLLLLWLASGAKRSDGMRLGLPLCVLAAGLLLWDGARQETSIFLQAAANNQPANGLADPALWFGRLREWLGMGAWLLGPPGLTVSIVAVALSSLLRRQRPAKAGRSFQFERLMFLAVLAYLGTHTILNFNLYPRYLVLIAPLLILMVAGRLAAVFARIRIGKILVLCTVAMVLAGTVYTLGTSSPFDEARVGLDRLAAHLNAKPVATVIYDPWLGWELGYYLGQWHNKRRVHYPTAEAMVAGATALEEAGARYLVAPTDKPYQSWLTALVDAGFQVSEDYRRDRFAVFRLIPPSPNTGG